MSSYVSLFLALVKRKGYNCEITDPQLVNASATPPPSRCYPGLVCYMVTITVNKVEYHGYGPTAGLARQFAAFQAYKALAPVLKKDVTKSVQDSGVDCAQDDDAASVSTLDDALSVCSEPVIEECTTNSLSQSADEDNDNESTVQEEQYQQDPLANQESKGVSNHSPEPSAAGSEKHSEKWFPNGHDKPSNNVPAHERLNKIGDNPVGQLQEVFSKEFKTMPVFAESVQVSGGNIEFICTVEINNLSARGIGQSKKLARRHAAENMLAVMIDKGINVNPSKNQRGMKKSNPKRGWTEPRYHTPFQQGHGRFHPKQNNKRFTRYNSFPSDSHNGPPRARSIHPANHRHFPRTNPRGRGLLPLPFLPVPPLRVPVSDIVYENVTDSDSDTECANSDIISAGLCEVLPPDLQSNNIQCLEKTRQPSSSSSPETSLSTTASLGTTNSAPGHKAQQSISTESPSDIHSNEFSDIASPFAAHSDPFQFTVRLPRSSGSPWSSPVGTDGATVPKKSPPSKDLMPQQPLVDTGEVHSSSLPVHPLFVSTPMVQYPAHLHSVTQSREGDSSRHSVQSVVLGGVSNDLHDDRSISSGSEGDSVVLTNDISVGLPSEGSVSASLMTFC